MKDVIIRQARIEDAARFLPYLKQVGGETDNLSFGAEGLPLSVDEEKAFLQSQAESKNSVIFVAERDGNIIGDGSLSGLSRRMHHRAELGISVVKEEWGKGIGSELMRQLLQYAKDNGIEILHLEARADNQAAIHLYRKFGFRDIGLFPGFLKHRGAYYDALLMYLDLR